jgi:hypothetical protein
VDGGSTPCSRKTGSARCDTHVDVAEGKLQCARMKHQVAGCSIGARQKLKHDAVWELAEDGPSSVGPPPDGTMHSSKKWRAGERRTGNRRYTVYFFPQSYNCLLNLLLPHAASIMFNIFRCQLQCYSTSVMPSTSDLRITTLYLILAYTFHCTCVALFLIYSVNHRM